MPLKVLSDLQIVPVLIHC